MSLTAAERGNDALRPFRAGPKFFVPQVETSPQIQSPRRCAVAAIAEPMVVSEAKADPAAGPLPLYRTRRKAGHLQPDPAQELAAEKLQSLHNALRNYEPAAGSAGWRERLGLGRRKVDPPQGLYIFGGVGRGKSMLMDLFFLAAPVPKKQRVHFHAFMLEVHDSLHRRRQSGEADGDPIPPLAQEIADSAWLLCFDEFHVSNIADAMLLGRLFEALFHLGVVVVATSNVAPGDLYAGGLQRDRFLPFIELLKLRMDVLELDGVTDYRLKRLKDLSVYHHPLGGRATAALDEAFERMTDGATATAATMIVQGRRLSLPRTANGVARMSYAELCEQPLGAADYLEIARHFHTIIIDDVPKMSADQRNEARRFMILIDALYEHKVNLLMSAAASPERLYEAGDGAQDFKRTASRLIEMQSIDYLAKAHLA
jgi:cell division protein ZapE